MSMNGRRKPRVPRPILQNPVAYVMSGLKTPDKKLQEHLSFINHGSLHALTHGIGTGADWYNIAIALRVAINLANIGWAYENRSVFLQALQGHNACGERYVSGKTFGYSGEELRAINTAMDKHEDQLHSATVLEIEQAWRAAEKAVKPLKG